MATPDQPDKAKPAQSEAAPRSEGLLPAERGNDDGRLDVAEEVNLDQQSDTARHVGQAPATNPQDQVRRSVPGAK